MRKNGYVTGCSAGDTVPYVICLEQVTFMPSSYHSSGEIVSSLNFSILFISAMPIFFQLMAGGRIKCPYRDFSASKTS